MREGLARPIVNKETSTVMYVDTPYHQSPDRTHPEPSHWNPMARIAHLTRLL